MQREESSGEVGVIESVERKQERKGRGRRQKGGGQKESVVNGTYSTCKINSK